MNMRRLVLIILVAMLAADAGIACTSAIVSGKYTADGRPLLWKHRDNDVPESKLVFLTGGKYDGIGLVNFSDERANSIWIGVNSEGFVIMNTLSYNIESEATSSGDRNGTIMKEALLSCASVAEFEAFLDNYSRPLKVRANFGVIDAKGGAAYFETNNQGYVKIDVNDPMIAPHGYVVRTNYSFTGEPSAGAGYIRFQTAENLFYKASGSNGLNVPYLLKNMCRSLDNSYTGEGIKSSLSLNEHQEKFIYYQDCINRYTSTSSVVVHGVREGESPALTTMWAIVGFPLSSVAIPVWVNSGKSLPSVITAPGRETAEVCGLSLEMKELMVPSTRGSTKYYINTTKVANSNGTGITQLILKSEEPILAKAFAAVEEWRSKNKIDQAQLISLNKWIDDHVRRTYSENFGVRKTTK
jgi:hypothetical protein